MAPGKVGPAKTGHTDQTHVNQTESVVASGAGPINALKLHDIAGVFKRCLNGGHDGTPSCKAICNGTPSCHLAGLVGAAAVAAGRFGFKLYKDATVIAMLEEAGRLQVEKKPMAAAAKYVEASVASKARAKEYHHEDDQEIVGERRKPMGNELHYLLLAADAREQAANLYGANARLWARNNVSGETRRIALIAAENAGIAADLYWEAGNLKGDARATVTRGVVLLWAGETPKNVGTFYGEWLDSVTKKYYGEGDIPKALEYFAEEAAKIGQEDLAIRVFHMASDAYDAIIEAAREKGEELKAEADEFDEDVDQKTYGEQVEREAMALEAQADVLTKLGKFDEAWARLVSARELFIARSYHAGLNIDGTRKTVVNADNFEGVVRLLGKEAAVLFQLDDYEAALEANNRAISYLRELIDRLKADNAGLGEDARSSKIVAYEQEVQKLEVKSNLLTRKIRLTTSAEIAPAAAAEIERCARELASNGKPITLARLVELIARQKDMDRSVVHQAIVTGRASMLGIPLLEKVEGFREAVAAMPKAAVESKGSERTEGFWEKLDEAMRDKARDGRK